MNKNNNVGGIIVLVIFILLCFTSCSGSSSSSYNLHNKDGSLNMEYVSDMWEWQAKQK